MEIEPDTEKFGRIGVLMGGPSSEREISLKSGRAVFQALTQLGLDAVAIDIVTADPGENIRLLRAQAIRTAFIALHGCFGEDGQVQRLLEGMGIPYTGSAPDSHRLALDKTLAREVFMRSGLKVPDCAVVTKGKVPDAAGIRSLGLPLAVKPATQGSSIGLSVIDTLESLGPALERAFAYDGKVLVEQYIKGRELTVGILGNAPLPVIEIVPKRRFFDFEAKYQQGMTEYIIPAETPPETAVRAQRVAQAAHAALGCAGCSRTDIMLAAGTGELFILEVNTIPGMTSTSLLPKAARMTGIEFPDLCLRLLQSAYEKK